MVDGKGHDLCMRTGNVNISKHTNFVLKFFPLFSLFLFVFPPLHPLQKCQIQSSQFQPPPPFFFFYKRTLRILSAEF